MIINKFISCKSVIEDVYRDTQMEEALPFDDLIYWIYEALALMDQPIQFVRKVTGYKENPNLDIQNYRAELPCDFFRLERIAVNGFAARYANGSFHHLLGGDCCNANSNSFGNDVFIDNFGNLFAPQSSQLLNTPVVDSYTFDINDNFLTLSVKEGQCCIAYLAFPTDESGFPQIPDDITYKVACKKYLMQKIRYIAWAKDPNNSGKRALYEHDEKEWLWYVGKATSKAKIPHPEQMESLKNQVVRLIPKINEHDTFFNVLGAKQLNRIR